MQGYLKSESMPWKSICDYWRLKFNYSTLDLIQFEATIWAKHSMDNYGFGFKD